MIKGCLMICCFSSYEYVLITTSNPKGSLEMSSSTASQAMQWYQLGYDEGSAAFYTSNDFENSCGVPAQYQSFFSEGWQAGTSAQLATDADWWIRLHAKRKDPLPEFSLVVKRLLLWPFSFFLFFFFSCSAFLLQLFSFSFFSTSDWMLGCDSFRIQK